MLRNVTFVVRTRRISRVPVNPNYFEELALHPKTKNLKELEKYQIKDKMLLVSIVVLLKRNETKPNEMKRPAHFGECKSKIISTYLPFDHQYQLEW